MNNARTVKERLSSDPTRVRTTATADSNRITVESILCKSTKELALPCRFCGPVILDVLRNTIAIYDLNGRRIEKEFAHFGALTFQDVLWRLRQSEIFSLVQQDLTDGAGVRENSWSVLICGPDQANFNPLCATVEVMGKWMVNGEAEECRVGVDYNVVTRGYTMTGLFKGRTF